MSLKLPLFVLASAIIGTGGTIWYVHYGVEKNNESMKQNVLRDIEMEEIKKKIIEYKSANGIVSVEESNCEDGICELRTSKIVK